MKKQMVLLLTTLLVLISINCQKTLPESEVKTAKLSVENMECKACAVRIKSGLKKCKGIKEINILLKIKEVNVLFDEKIISENEIITKIKDIGFKVKK